MKSIIVVIMAVALFGCSGRGSPTSPSVPDNTNPAQTLSEVYVFPEGWGFNTSSMTYVHIPGNCIKATILKIDPGRDSFLPANYEARLSLNWSVCAEAPILNGFGYSPSYDFIDESGNHATDWLAGMSAAVLPGMSKDVDWGVKVYMDLPPKIYALRLRLRYGEGGGSDFLRINKSIFVAENPPIEVRVPIGWHTIE
jgi:hypothetical protein